jgi:hypothetical protein
VPLPAATMMAEVLNQLNRIHAGRKTQSGCSVVKIFD